MATGRVDWALPIDKGVQTGGRRKFGPLSGKGVKRRSFPAGISCVPVEVRIFDDSEFRVDLLGGFLAVRQDLSDGALAPLIGSGDAPPGGVGPEHAG